MTEPLLNRLAGLAHDHRLVPFLGAGCSLAHVSVDWDGITELMAAALGGRPHGASNPEVAEMFLAKEGDEALAALLSDHLLIESFDDSQDTLPVQVLALELRALYTTNQDNVVEKAAEHFGVPLVTVATLDELATVRPGDRVLYKFHGSLEHPETLVFASSQYARRMANSDNFLNIRLKSDLLTKTFLFIGYSFRDPNIKDLFLQLDKQFGSALPGSYLLAYRWSQELDALCRAHGVECIDPSAHIDSPTGAPGRDLEAFLRCLCERAFGLSTQEQLEDLFHPKKPSPVRVAIRSQVDAVRGAVAANGAGAISAFRGAFDGVVVPEGMQQDVADCIVDIIRAAPAGLQGEIQGALFNLRLSPDVMLEPVAAYLAFSNRIPQTGMLDMIHSPPGNAWPAPLVPLAAARAVELLDEWGEEITDNFRSRSSHWFDRHWPQFPEKLKPYVRGVMRGLWARKHTTYEEPTERAERLAALPHGQLFSSPGFEAIHNSLLASLPKRFKTPRE